MFFGQFIPTILQAIFGSGANAIPAMTAAAGGAGAAGGTVGGAAPTVAAPTVDPIIAEGEPMTPTISGSVGAGGNVAGAGGGSGPLGGSGGAQVGGTKPLEVGAGGRYGGTERDGSRPTASQISGVPDDWLPYKVPTNGFERAMQRWGGNDPAARNAEFLANKQKFGMQQAMEMEKQARSEQGMWNRQKDDQNFRQGQQQRRTQAERDAERERRGFQVVRENQQNEWAAKNADRVNTLNRMEDRADKYGTYDPIVQQDTANQMREAQLKRLQAPVSVGAGMVWDPNNPGSIGVIDRGADAFNTIGQGGNIIPIPARPPGISFSPMGGSVPPAPAPPAPAPNASGVYPTANPANLSYTQPATGGNPAWLDTILQRISGGRPNMYSAPR